MFHCWVVCWEAERTFLFVVLARDMGLTFHGVGGEWHGVVVFCGIVLVSNCLHGI